MKRLFIWSCQLIGHLLLFVIGWKIPEESSIENLFKHPQVVCVFSHSSYFDIIILFIYMLLHPTYLNKVCVLVMPQAFKHLGPLLRFFNCLEAPRKEDRNSNSIQRILEQLKQREQFLFLLSPKGTVHMS